MELFAEQGYGATSVPEICARAGLTKGAFYSNFVNKDALFLALLDRSWQRRAEWIRRVMPGSEALARSVMSGEPLPVLEPDREWTLVSVEFSLHAIRHPEVAVQLVEHEARARAGLAALIAEALEQAGRVPIVPVMELARMVVAVAEGSGIQELTDAAAGTGTGPSISQQAIPALLRQFSSVGSASAGPASAGRAGAGPASAGRAGAGRAGAGPASAGRAGAGRAGAGRAGAGPASAGPASAGPASAGKSDVSGR
jgi:AcrR family transcriptional regulator